MHIGLLRLSLRLPGNDNLKGKRRVVHSVVSRLRTKFNVSVAEVDHMDSWQRITLGVTCVSNDGRHANSMISSVIRFVEKTHGEIEILDYEIEILDGP